MSLLSIRDLSVSYPARAGVIRAVSNLDLELEAGQTLGIVGESGSGKSQTALAMIGLLPSSAQVSGSIRFEDRELIGLPREALDRLRGARIGTVFQDPMSSLNPYRTVGAQLAEVLVQHRDATQAAALAEACRMLDAVGIANARQRLRQHPHEFSGGMRQRVTIAMALLCQPALLIADEPTTALDVTVQAQILDLLAELRSAMNLALILITHDLGVVAEHCERVQVMYAGRVVETGNTQELLGQPRHPYTQGLLASRPRRDRPLPERLFAIPGAPPNPSKLPNGCAFAPRCLQVMTACRVTRPVLEAGPASGHRSACHLTTP